MGHHKGKAWTNNNMIEYDCAKCKVFESNLLPNGKLPTLHSVLCYYFYLRTSPVYDQRLVDHGVTLDVMSCWINCNVYL